MRKAVTMALVCAAIFAAGLRVASAACTPITSAFPGALDTFVPNNCIPAAWANSTEQAIGTTTSTATSSLRYAANVLGSTTPLFQVNSNRSDSYVANGSYLFPFQSLAAAIASSTGFSAYAYNLTPGTYVDGPPDTFGNSPFVITGNESTYIPASGVTFPGSFDIYDLTIAGNVTESDNSLAFIHQFNNGVITGNTTMAGLATLSDMVLPTVTSTLTALPGSLVNVVGTAVYSNVVADGVQANFNDVLLQGSSSNFEVNSTSGEVIFNGATVINSGSGGGISVNNGATSSPNIINSVSVLVNSSTPGSAITAGSAATVLCNVTGINNFVGAFIAPVGSNWKPCYDEDRSVLNYLVVATATPPVTSFFNAGSAGSLPTLSSVSSTLTAASTQFQVFTGASAATATLPTVSSSIGQLLTFKNRGTAALSIAQGTSTNFIWLSGSNASATAYSLSPGSSTAFQNDGVFWDQLWK